MIDRELVNISNPSYFTNKKVLITGASGSIGSEIVRQLMKQNPADLILLDCAETPLYSLYLDLPKTTNIHIVLCSINNESRIDFIFNKYRPDYVFHTAAYKHIPMLELNPSEAVQNNILGTTILAKAAIKYNVKKFIFTSTDKAVDPTNVYGCSKRICELYLLGLKDNRFRITRFGNVVGSIGSVIPLFQKQINSGGPVTITHPEMSRYFMNIPEAALLTLEACIYEGDANLFVFNMGEPIKIVDIAKKLIGNQNIKIVYTGLRSGEKLEEKLFNDYEDYIPYNNLLTVNTNYKDITNDILDLINISHTYNSLAIVQKMMNIVPNFIPNNPEFYLICK